MIMFVNRAQEAMSAEIIVIVCISWHTAYSGIECPPLSPSQAMSACSVLSKAEQYNNNAEDVPVQS
jgi:hypothetical protein